MPSTEDVAVQMRNGLASVAPIVDHEPVTAFFQPERCGHFCGFEKQMPQRALVRLGRVGDSRDGLFGDDQDMDRCMGMNVSKGQNNDVFVHDLRRNFAGRDFFKEGFAHATLSHHQSTRSGGRIDHQAAANEFHDLIAQLLAAMTPALGAEEFFYADAQATEMKHLR